MILDKIVETKRKEVELLKEKLKLPLKHFELAKIRRFRKALIGHGVKLIAETKAASPSAGIIFKKYSPVTNAKAFEKAGASAVSVLTDAKYFHGGIGDLTKVKASIKLPVLRKDFIIDASQIYESRLAGADAILLIARILKEGQLEYLIRTASDLGMDAFVEVHSSKEAVLAIESGAEIIGINNRDLDTLKVDLRTTLNIINEVPDLRNKIIVSESGIKTKEDINLLKSAGVNAVLVGEAILKSRNMKEKIKELIG
jgi:indole-3-glycerol phosphate synthase